MLSGLENAVWDVHTCGPSGEFKSGRYWLTNASGLLRCCCHSAWFQASRTSFKAHSNACRCILAGQSLIGQLSRMSQGQNLRNCTNADVYSRSLNARADHCRRHIQMTVYRDQLGDLAADCSSASLYTAMPTAGRTKYVKAELVSSHAGTKSRPLPSSSEKHCDPCTCDKAR